jgi:protein-tyrosine phosphatase
MSLRSDIRFKVAAAKLYREDREPNAILGHEYLYVGSFGAVQNPSILTGVGVTHILCVADGLKTSDSLSEHGFQCLDLDVLDRPGFDIESIFIPAFEFINAARESGGKVLVHCFQGKSRSITICCAYLMRYFNMGFVEGLDLIRESRSIAAPNLGFIVALRKYEKYLANNQSSISDLGKLDL